MASDCMPEDSAIFAMFIALRCLGVIPVRIFSVTGASTALTTASKMSPTFFSSAHRAEPALLLQTFFAGQTILISIIYAPLSIQSFAAVALICGCVPEICTMRG